MWFRSVKFVRPFCYRIITFFVVNKIRTKVVQKVKRIVDAILRNWEMLCDFSVHCHHSPWKAKCASTTKSITSSVALTSCRSQNQSTQSSAGNMVSNMKSCRSVSDWVEKRFVLFIPVWWHRSQIFVVRSDTKLRKRFLRLLVPIIKLVLYLTFLQQMWVVFFYFCNQFIDRILIKIFIHLII